MYFYNTPPLTKVNYFANALDIGITIQRKDEHGQNKTQLDGEERLNLF